MMSLNVGRGADPDVRLAGWKHSNQWIFTHMLLSALLSLYSAFRLSLDTLVIAGNPDAVFGCDINAVLSCGTVGRSWQAEVFGVPNTFIGLMCEPVVVTIAVAGIAGVKFPRWFMFAAQMVYLVGLTFAYWLFSQSILYIHALCPYCLLITLGTTLVFFTLLHYNIRENNLYLPPKAQRAAETFARVHGTTAVAVLLLLGILSIILYNYGTVIFSLS